jgi:hypothetical protein
MNPFEPPTFAKIVFLDQPDGTDHLKVKQPVPVKLRPKESECSLPLGAVPCRIVDPKTGQPTGQIAYMPRSLYNKVLNALDADKETE